MANELNEKIRRAQIAAGERAVMDHLEELGIRKPRTEAPPPPRLTNREADVIDKARMIAALPVEFPNTILGDNLRRLRDLVCEMDAENTAADARQTAGCADG